MISVVLDSEVTTDKSFSMTVYQGIPLGVYIIICFNMLKVYK